MWPKERKLHALLAPLSPVIGGQVSDGTLSGSYLALPELGQRGPA